MTNGADDGCWNNHQKRRADGLLCVSNSQRREKKHGRHHHDTAADAEKATTDSTNQTDKRRDEIVHAPRVAEEIRFVQLRVGGVRAQRTLPKRLCNRPRSLSFSQMVSAIPNPALDAFIARVSPEIVFAEAIVRQVLDGFDVRHVADCNTSTLRLVSAAQLREIAQFTEHKQFRPLKSAPTLQRGWHFLARNASDLDYALQCLYPGGISDWFAVQCPAPPITHYRDFTARQTGMYRATASLSDEQVAHVARAGCHKRFCLKQRLWGVEGLSPDDASEKSLIPCLEPCAVLLEFARVIARFEQREKHSVQLTSEEIATVAMALERMASARQTETREADFAAPDNGRHAQRILEKLRPLRAPK